MSRATHLLVDFDGPICSIFGGLSAADAASRLRQHLAAAGITLPAGARKEGDPLEVFRRVASTYPEHANLAHDELTALEVEAAHSAVATPYARDALAAARQHHQTVSIVSNNSAAAISLYLELRDLGQYVWNIAARTSGNPALMKPDPHLIRVAVSAIRGVPAQCVLIGDSVSDVQAARTVGIPVIGYANKPGKGDHLSEAGATTIITSMSALIP